MHIRSADLVAWLRTRVTATGAEGLVVPLIESLQAAVVSRLCQLAAPDAVLGALLPGVAEERVRARTLAEQLQLPLVDIDCYAATALVDEMRGHVEDIGRRSVASPGALPAQGTLSTRVHMASVHFVADSLNYLIAGTLDRTDLTLGAFTRYAESDVDLLPLGTAHRSEVIALARDLELPPSLFERVPVAHEGVVSHQDLERYQADGPDGVAPAVALRIERLMRESDRKRAPAELPDEE
jgi:NAD+ synthase